MTASDATHSPVHAESLGLHHVGIVVADLDAAVARYRVLGFGEPERFAIPEQKVNAAVFTAGPGYVELIQPTDPEGPIARYLAKRGEGMHHLALRVAELPTTIARLADAAVRLIDTEPRIGTHGWRIAFVHPESCNGVLVELVEE